MTDAERWRPAPGYEARYEVSDQGRVRTLDRESIDRRGRRHVVRARILRPWKQGSTGEGYWTVWLYGEDGPHSWRIHRLVLLAFDRAPLPDEHGRHLDGDVDNNRLVNLAWGSPSENGLDTVRNGRHPKANATQCREGHSYDEENTKMRHRNGRPSRVCRECRNAKRRSGNRVTSPSTPTTVGGQR